MTALQRIRDHSGFMRLLSLQFVSLAAVGMVAPYVNLLLVEAEFSATLIGTLSSVGAILALTITPLLNQFADRRMLHRRLFMGYMLAFALANAIFASTQIHILLIIGVMLTKLTISPSMTLGMQLTMTEAARRSTVVLGQIRSFAAMGFSAASLLAGRLFNVGGFPFLFGIGAVFALITMQIATIFPAQSKIKDKSVDGDISSRHRGFYVLIASQFFIAMGIQNSFAFLFIHLTENLGFPTGDIGMWAALLAGVEIPFFMLTDKVLPKIQTRFAYTLGGFGLAMYTFLLGTTDSSLILIGLIFFRGVVWPIYHLSSFAIVAEISKQKNIATNQAILQVTVPSIAMLLTGSAFGWVFEHLGALAFFGLSGFASVTGVCILIVFYRLLEIQPKIAGK